MNCSLTATFVQVFLTNCNDIIKKIDQKQTHVLLCATKKLGWLLECAAVAVLFSFDLPINKPFV